MTKRTKTTALILMATLLTLGASADAQRGTTSTSGAPGGKAYELQPTPAGWEIGAAGLAVLESAQPDRWYRTFDRLAVRADAKVEDGTVFVVSVMVPGAKQPMWHDVGSMTIRLGSGYLELNERNGSSYAFPVDEILAISVRYGDEEILSANTN